MARGQPARATSEFCIILQKNQEQTPDKPIILGASNGKAESIYWGKENKCTRTLLPPTPTGRGGTGESRAAQRPARTESVAEPPRCPLPATQTPESPSPVLRVSALRVIAAGAPRGSGPGVPKSRLGPGRAPFEPVRPRDSVPSAARGGRRHAPHQRPAPHLRPLAASPPRQPISSSSGAHSLCHALRCCFRSFFRFALTGCERRGPIGCGREMAGAHWLRAGDDGRPLAAGGRAVRHRAPIGCGRCCPRPSGAAVPPWCRPWGTRCCAGRPCSCSGTCCCCTAAASRATTPSPGSCRRGRPPPPGLTAIRGRRSSSAPTCERRAGAGGNAASRPPSPAAPSPQPR